MSASVSPFQPSRWLDRSKFANQPEGTFPLSVSLLSWGYNEEENIEEFLLRSLAFMEALGVDYEHILIDDCSTDRTYEIALQVQKVYPRLRIIRNETNRNSGWNTRIAIRNATKDVLFWQTADWAYDIARAREYLGYLKDFDVVQGARFLQSKRTGILKYIPVLNSVEVMRRSDNLRKAVVSVVNYVLVRYLFGVPLSDFQNVTFYPTRLAQAIECETSTSFTNPELIMKSYWKGSSILQVPIGFLPRKKGTAKGTRFLSIVASIRQILYYWIKWIVMGRRPDKSRGSVQALSSIKPSALQTYNQPVSELI